MKTSFLAFALLLLICSPQYLAAEETIPLGNAGPEAAKTEIVTRMHGSEVVRNVTQPSLLAYRPEKPNGTAVVVAPGGALMFLAINHEGRWLAQWLQKRGITAFVLKYRTIPTPTEHEAFEREMGQLFGGDRNPDTLARIHEQSLLSVADGQAAIAHIRQHAQEYAIDPHRIVMIGFSAGGAVTAGTALQPDAETRPDYAALIYGAPSLADPEKVRLQWDQSPPVFMAVAADDGLVASSQIPFYQKLRAHDIQAELHIYAEGNHGFGMYEKGTTSDHWKDAFYWWLQAHQLADQPLYPATE
ncbi:MAG: alpha/beta hydrolase [Verrucomicrobiota bacterium JB022]|nr:alpha/beta hydrolase [Verrucomicrobiota bacterium JB022]